MCILALENRYVHVAVFFIRNRKTDLISHYIEMPSQCMEGYGLPEGSYLKNYGIGDFNFLIGGLN